MPSAVAARDRFRCRATTSKGRRQPLSNGFTGIKSIYTVYGVWTLYSNPELPIRSRRKRRPAAIRAIDGCNRYKDGDCLDAPWRAPTQRTEARMQKSRRPNFLILKAERLAGHLLPDRPAA